METINNLQSLRFIRLAAAADKTGMGRSTILAWEAQGKFPRAVRLAPNLRVWLESDLDKWILELHAKREEISLKPAEPHHDH